MTKISKIELNDFRGFEGPRTFDFGDADLIIFLGMNGFGKTSIFDSVEWCLTGHLTRYEGYLEAGRRQDFAKEKEVLRNKYASNPNTLVKIELSDGNKFGRRITVGPGEPDYCTGSIIDGYNFDLKSISNQEIDPEFAHHYFSATHILSQETINHFITSKRPEDRYKALSINFGTSLYEPFENNAQNLIAEFKKQEDEANYRLKSESKRLADFQGQIQIQDEQVNNEVGAANKIIDSLGMLAQEYGLTPYVMQDKQIKGLGKEEVQKLIADARDAREILEKKIETLRSLISDHEAWKDKNKELKALDSRIIENKQKAAKIKANKASLEAISKQIKALETDLEKQNHEFNQALEIEKKLPFYLESKKTIDALTQDINKRQSASTLLQSNLVKATEEELSSQERLKIVAEKLSEIELLNNELGIDGSKLLEQSENRAALNKQVGLLDGQLSEMLERRELFRKAEDFLNNEFSSLEGDELKTALGNFKIFDENTIQNILSIKSSKLLLSLSLKSLGFAKDKVDEAYQKHTHEVSRSKALLATALDIIDEDTEKCACPVCDTTHSTDELLLSIKEKLNDESSSSFVFLNERTSKLDLEMDNLKKLEQLEIKKLDESKSIILKSIHDFLGFLNNEIEKISLGRAKLEEQIKSAIEAEARLKGRLGVVLNKNIEDLSKVQALFKGTLDNFSNEKKKLEEIVNKSKKDKLEFVKQIDVSITENKIAQDSLKNLQSTDFISINTFLVQREIPIRVGTTATIEDFLAPKRALIAQISEQLNDGKAQKIKNEESLSELVKDKPELVLENETIELSGKITEINRFLLDYKGRCSRVSVALDSPKKDIETTKKSVEKLFSEKNKLLGMLDALLEKTKVFSLFMKEDAVRKKLLKVQKDIEKISANLRAITRAKSDMDNLKKKFPDAIQKYINKNLDESLFNKIYQSLNPHRRFQSIDLDVKVSHNKVGIHFDAKQSKISGRPEFLFSSAQLNTFGVSMFLSMALRQNWLKLDTVLLDDPIQNLDDINILSFIDLIRGLLDFKSGKQVIMSTHDERFYNLVKHKFTDYKLKAFKYESYGRVMPDVL